MCYCMGIETEHFAIAESLATTETEGERGLMRDTIIAIHQEKEIGSPDFLFSLTFDLEKEGEQWTATCLELGTSTFGDTLDEARQELQEAVTLQLNEMERLGFIADYLQENRVPVIRLADAAPSGDSRFTLASA